MVVPATYFRCEDSLEAFTSLAIEQGWSDGLPLVPPTKERVALMVGASGRGADESRGYIEPSGGEATVEKIAANAVMAGCAPAFMPVLLAMVEALQDPRYNAKTALTTTTCTATAIILHGAIRQKLGVNCGYGALGPGWRANATIGRAFRLITQNIGGAKAGPIDRSTLGLPAKYTFCFGELEEESPWEPLHYERGMPQEASALTLAPVQSTTDVSFPYKKAADLLTIVADAMQTMGVTGIFVGDGDPILILTPGQARILYQSGWTTKQKVKEWLYEHSKIPIDRFPTGPAIVRYHERWQRHGDWVYVTDNPNAIVIVVAGGDEPYHAVYCANLGGARSVTKTITGLE